MNRSEKSIVKARTNSAEIPCDSSVLLDEFQVARIRNCSVFTLRRERWSGGGIPYLKIKGTCRYRRSDVDSFLDACIRTSTSQA